MYPQLVQVNKKPIPFEFYTTEILWNAPHISKQMLAYHLNQDADKASRNKGFIDQSICWITSHFSIGRGARICDFGCGPGLYTLALAKEGAAVTGVDFSRRSIEYAKQTAALNQVSIHYVLDNYLEFETNEKFDLVMMIMCDFCVLSPNQRVRFLKKCRSMLKEDGIFLFDGYSVNAYEKVKESAIYEHALMDGFWSEEDYFGFLNIYKYPAEMVTLDQYTIVEAQRTWQVYNWLQYYDLNTLSETLRACGFEIAEKYRDVCGTAYAENADEFAVVAKLC